MKNIFEKKQPLDVPKRHAIHKFFIFMIFMSLVNSLFQFFSNNMTLTILYIINSALWTITVIFSEKKYQKTVIEHIAHIERQEQISQIKKAFDFTHYHKK